MRIAVAGATGILGRRVVAAARDRGHEVAALSRSAGSDVLTGAGVAAALAGCDAVVDAVGTTSQSARSATQFFEGAAKTLQREAAAAGLGRVVVVSIVGLESVQGLGYYRAKLAHEQAHRRGPVPAQVVRSTQFHDFPAQMLQRTRVGPVAVTPRMRTQPVDAAAVAAVILDTLEAAHPPPLRQVGGPRPEDLVELTRRWVAHHRSRVAVVPLRLPGAAGRALRGGALLPGDDADLVGPTFEEWLAH